MGILSALGIVKEEAQAALSLDEDRISEIEKNLSIIKDEVEKVLADVKSGEIKKAEHELFLVKSIDSKVLKGLKQGGDHEGYLRAKKILSDVREALEKIDNDDVNFQKLLNHIILLDNELFEHELKLGDDAEEMKKKIIKLLRKDRLTEAEVKSFFKEFGWSEYRIGKKLPKRKGISRNSINKIREALEKKVILEIKAHQSKGSIENPEGRAKARVVFIYTKKREPENLNEIRELYKFETNGHKFSIDVVYDPVQKKLKAENVRMCEDILKKKLGIDKFKSKIPQWD